MLAYKERQELSQDMVIMNFRKLGLQLKIRKLVFHARMSSQYTLQYDRLY